MRTAQWASLSIHLATASCGVSVLPPAIRFSPIAEKKNNIFLINKVIFKFI